MSEFGVRIGFYKIMGENPKDVTISFDGADVATLTVTSLDINNPNWAEFTVNKDNGVYPCLITPENVFDGESVGITTVYVKPTVESRLFPGSWYDLRVRPINSDGSVIFPVDTTSVKTKAACFYDEPALINIEVESAEILSNGDYGRYRWPEISDRIADFQQRLTTGKDKDGIDLSTEVIENIQDRIQADTKALDIINNPTVNY